MNKLQTVSHFTVSDCLRSKKIRTSLCVARWRGVHSALSVSLNCPCFQVAGKPAPRVHPRPLQGARRQKDTPPRKTRSHGRAINIPAVVTKLEGSRRNTVSVRAGPTHATCQHHSDPECPSIMLAWYNLWAYTATYDLYILRIIWFSTGNDAWFKIQRGLRDNNIWREPDEVQLLPVGLVTAWIHLYS